MYVTGLSKRAGVLLYLSEPESQHLQQRPIVSKGLGLARLLPFGLCRVHHQQNCQNHNWLDLQAPSSHQPAGVSPGPDNHCQRRQRNNVPGLPISTMADENKTKTSRGVDRARDSASRLIAPIALGITHRFHPSPLCYPKPIPVLGFIRNLACNQAMRSQNALSQWYHLNVGSPGLLKADLPRSWLSGKFQQQVQFRRPAALAQQPALGLKHLEGRPQPAMPQRSALVNG